MFSRLESLRPTPVPLRKLTYQMRQQIYLEVQQNTSSRKIHQIWCMIQERKWENGRGGLPKTIGWQSFRLEEQFYQDSVRLRRRGRSAYRFKIALLISLISFPSWSHSILVSTAIFVRSSGISTGLFAARSIASACFVVNMEMKAKIFRWHVKACAAVSAISKLLDRATELFVRLFEGRLASKAAVRSKMGTLVKLGSTMS